MDIKRLICDPDYTLKSIFVQPILDFYFKKTGRVLGCESKNHAQCRGELWQCERCGRRICWEEGSADLPELCDYCWVDVRIHGATWEEENWLEDVCINTKL